MPTISCDLHVTRDVVMCMKIRRVAPDVPRAASPLRSIEHHVHAMENTGTNHFARQLRGARPLPMHESAYSPRSCAPFSTRRNATSSYPKMGTASGFGLSRGLTLSLSLSLSISRPGYGRPGHRRYVPAAFPAQNPRPGGSFPAQNLLYSGFSRPILGTYVLAGSSRPTSSYQDFM